jgi:hypothetical protein
MPDTIADFSMFSAAGNAAVARLVDQLDSIADRPDVTRHRELVAEAAKLVTQVARRHPEVRDTEPRCEIADRIDAISAQRGWVNDCVDGTRWEL